MTLGYVDTNYSVQEEEWYISNKYYVLSEMIGHKTSSSSDDEGFTGIELKFEPSSSLSGWPDVTHLFGSTDVRDEDASINRLVTETRICVQSFTDSSLLWKNFVYAVEVKEINGSVEDIDR